MVFEHLVAQRARPPHHVARGTRSCCCGNTMMNTTTPDLVVFSHLRWDFVFQRPQHLLTRTARLRRVFFVEEPVIEASDFTPTLAMTPRDSGVQVVLPRLPGGLTRQQTDVLLQELLNTFMRQRVASRFISWYYTPMALAFTRGLKPLAVVYDCMDELSNFKGAPPELCTLEDELLRRADVVFTGGISLYEHKSAKHRNIHPFPSSVDTAHFGTARSTLSQPSVQQSIPRPRLGYAGVIDERFDVELVRAIAHQRPDWQFVLIGPVVKIDPDLLPRGPNIHYLGSQPYADLPAFLAGWDVALLPFARNEATRFISPTKTPEYLAAGLSVVSTSIRDVVRGYGECGLASIADEPEDFVTAIETALARHDEPRRRDRADAVLAGMSWDRTHDAMWRVIESVPEPLKVLPSRSSRYEHGSAIVAPQAVSASSPSNVSV